MRYERLLQPPAEAGAHHPTQQESQQSGDPAARYRLHPGPAAGAGDAPGSAEAAAPAGATTPLGGDMSGRAAADPAHRAQHRPGRRGQQAGRQHSVSLSRAVQVCGRLSPSQETREGGGRAEVRERHRRKGEKTSANLRNVFIRHSKREALRGKKNKTFILFFFCTFINILHPYSLLSSFITAVNCTFVLFGGAVKLLNLSVTGLINRRSRLNPTLEAYL